MRKSISIMAAVAVLLMGVTSCSKDAGGSFEEGKTGNLTINFSLDDGSGTRATVSTAKPITTWGSITRMMILFVTPGTNVVADAKDVIIPASGAATTNQSAAFTNVKANTSGWDCYIVGNYPTSWSATNVIGKTVGSADLNVVAPVSTTYASSPFFKNGSTGYDESPEIFVAKQTGVVVEPDDSKTHPGRFKLARAVSLIRLRIDQSQNGNDAIDFTTAGAMFAIRRANTTYSMLGTYLYTTPDAVVGANSPGTYTPGPVETNVFFKAKAMQTANPTAALYTDNTSIIKDGVTLWNDYRIWAGGNAAPTTEGSQKFNIVISGLTKAAGYIPHGQTTALGANQRVYWTGNVIGKVGPNQILELIITLETKGLPEFPDVGSFGNLTVAVDVLPWGDIIPVDMPM